MLTFSFGSGDWGAHPIPLRRTSVWLSTGILSSRPGDKLMRRIVLVPVFALLSVVGAAAPAFGFIHVTIPGDNCAPAVADRNGPPGDNTTASDAIPGQVSRPLGGFKNAPTNCPAP